MRVSLSEVVVIPTRGRRFALFLLAAVSPDLAAAPAAYRVTGRDDGAVWACTPMLKVLKDAPVPEARQDAASLAAARNEYESIQIVLRPAQDLKQAVVAVSDLTSLPGRAAIHAGNLRVEWVEYVNVTKPTDELGKPGPWPDPLEPADGPRDLAGGENHPLWLTVFVPPDAPAGDYHGAVTVSFAGASALRVPLVLRVWGFTLPAEFHTRTAYGVDVQDDWHALKTDDERRQAYDLYLAALARHHLAPYSPMRYYPIREEERGGKRTLDFTEFDCGARRYLDDFHFNAFNLDLPLNFARQGSFPIAYRREFGERIRPILDHLRERGWLAKAYAYWQDEPGKDRYAWVQAGMQTLKVHAPGVRRLLTLSEEPAPLEPFYGLVDLWCPVMSCYNAATAPERQGLGESVWWYVCTGPKAPWPNNFIDHPGVTHRIRYWVMEKYNVEGDLYWSTTYWWQKNPWEDPQSYTYRAEGKDPNAVWGNGDGFLFYPPARHPPKAPLVKGPVASVRMALIRDGIEDREYFRVWERVRRAPPSAAPDAAPDPARGLVDALVQDFTHYERDAEKIEAARRKLAEMIERETNGRGG